MSQTASSTNEAGVISKSKQKRRHRGDRGSSAGNGREGDSTNNTNTMLAKKIPRGKKNHPDKDSIKAQAMDSKQENQRLCFTGAKIQNEAEPTSLIQDDVSIQWESQAAAERQAEETRKQAIFLAEKEEIELQISSKIHILSEFVSKIELHKDYRSKVSIEELKSFRMKFASNKSKLKTDLKKCTAFIRKLKSAPALDASTVALLIQDLDALNLTRYIQEIAQALLENKSRKVTDVMGLTQLCYALHLRYENWMDEWMPRIQAILKDKNSDSKSRRIFARVMVEMILYGIGETKPLLKLLADAAGSPGTGSGDNYDVTDANMVTSIVKAGGYELVGILPRSISIEIESLEKIAMTYKIHKQNSNSLEVGLDANLVDRVQPSHNLLQNANEVLRKLKFLSSERAVSFEVSERVQKHLNGAFYCLSTSLISNHKRLSKMKQRCAQDRLLSGSISEQREKTLDDAVQLLDSISKSVEVLADALNQPLPIIVEEEDEVKLETSGLEVYRAEDGQTELGPFDDEETKSFYCDIPDLLTTIPSAILGYKEVDVQKIKEANNLKYSVGFDQVQETQEFENISSETGEADPGNSEFIFEGSDFLSSGAQSIEEKDERKDTPHFKLMVLLEEELPECNRRDKVDILAEKFCTTHGAVNKSRKRLEKALVMIPRSRLDLIPYYSRLSAILDRVFPDITDALVKELEQQFHGMAKWKKQSNLENRIRNAKFIGELTKFRVAPPIVALRCFSRCLDDFSGHNVDVTCCLLESCGRFLFKMKHTSLKIVQVMDTMDRIRLAKHFDERMTELMKSAFYVAKPPVEMNQKKAKAISPVEDYIKNLFLVRLDMNNVAFVSKQILRLPWNDSTVDYGYLVVKYLLKTCRKGRYRSITAMADLVAKLKKHKPEVIARLVDSIYEGIQLIMERPHVRDQQRALSYTKFLGELYARALVSISEIFDQLYTFLNFDHDIPSSLYSASCGDSSVPPLTSALLRKSSLNVSQPILEEEEEEEEHDDDDDDDDENTEQQFNQSDSQIDKDYNIQKPVPVCLHSTYDPRVPSIIDPPYAVFRIKLTCTLLDNCAKRLATAANFQVLNNFLAAFQRYLFVKQSLPTDIEFALLDTFDILDSKLRLSKKGNLNTTSITRYENWSEAHNAVVAVEAADFYLKGHSRSRLLGKAGTSEKFNECDDESSNVDITSQDDESDDSSIDTTHDVCDSADDSEEFDDEGYDDENKSTEQDISMNDASSKPEDFGRLCSDVDDNLDGDYHSIGNEENQDDSDFKNLEDEAFEQELRKLTLEALEKGKISARTSAISKVSDSMPAASQFIRKKEHRELDVAMFTSLSLSGRDGISFQLIKRSNKGKAETKSIIVPLDTNLAKVASAKDAAAEKERDIVKARVLQYEKESENTHSGDVYLEQPKVKEVRNRTLRNYDIDDEFGRSSVRPLYSGGGRGTMSTGRGSQSGRGLKHF